MDNSVFFPQEVLDHWVIQGIAELRPGELVLLKEGRSFVAQEAVLVLREVTGAADPHDLLDRVKAVAELTEKGAEILEGSMILGDNAYDVAPGFLGRPAESFSAFLATPLRKLAKRTSGNADGADPGSDEDLLSSLPTPTM